MWNIPVINKINIFFSIIIVKYMGHFLYEVFGIKYWQETCWKKNNLIHRVNKNEIALCVLERRRHFLFVPLVMLIRELLYSHFIIIFTIYRNVYLSLL